MANFELRTWLKDFIEKYLEGKLVNPGEVFVQITGVEILMEGYTFIDYKFKAGSLESKGSTLIIKDTPTIEKVGRKVLEQVTDKLSVPETLYRCPTGWYGTYRIDEMTLKVNRVKVEYSEKPDTEVQVVRVGYLTPVRNVDIVDSQKEIYEDSYWGGTMLTVKNNFMVSDEDIETYDISMEDEPV